METKKKDDEKKKVKTNNGNKKTNVNPDKGYTGFHGTPVLGGKPYRMK